MSAFPSSLHLKIYSALTTDEHVEFIRFTHIEPPLPSYPLIIILPSLIGTPLSMTDAGPYLDMELGNLARDYDLYIWTNKRVGYIHRGDDGINELRWVPRHPKPPCSPERH